MGQSSKFEHPTIVWRPSTVGSPKTGATTSVLPQPKLQLQHPVKSVLAGVMANDHRSDRRLTEIAPPIGLGPFRGRTIGAIVAELAWALRTGG